MTKNQAIRWAGSQSELARRLKIKPQAVNKWPDNRVPLLRQYQIRELQAQASQTN